MQITFVAAPEGISERVHLGQDRRRRRFLHTAIVGIWRATRQQQLLHPPLQGGRGDVELPQELGVAFRIAKETRGERGVAQRLADGVRRADPIHTGAEEAVLSALVTDLVGLLHLRVCLAAAHRLLLNIFEFTYVLCCEDLGCLGFDL